MSASVENLRDALEALLACSVPYLHLEDLVLEPHDHGTELDADSDLVLLGELISSGSLHQTRLPHS